MVTADQVWAALAEIPDPEIPVISLVDLGVVKDVDVEDGTVRIDFTPTFMGCPALDVDAARDGGEGRGARREARGPRRPRRLLVDRRDHAGGPREAPRRRLRAARSATRRASSSSSSCSAAFRCPYCGSTDTKLENLFGPTPCRSIRYCDACRQPFEQFKTI